MDSTGGTGVSSSISLSEDGEFVSQLNAKELVFHLNPTSSEFQDAQIVKVKENLPRFVKISQASKGSGLSGRRVLYASDTRVLVWQLEPMQLHAEIDSIEPGATNVDFGGDENEVVVFHAWNTKLSIHGLDTGRSQVIKSPKSSHYNGFGYRPKTRQFAILLKPDAVDLLTIHEFRSYELIGRATLPTVDAQGMKWSPDGRWIAVWDAASAGTKVLIYTADGQPFRTYTGPPGADSSLDLGVRNIEWSPASSGGSSEFLAVGKVDGTVDLLKNKTFSCSTTLSHTFQMDQHSPSIWRERFATVDGDLEYNECSGSTAFSAIGEPTGPPRGVSIMAFSASGSLLCTVDQSRPNIIWIWALESTVVLLSALAHEHPVRQVVWHPSKSEFLVTTTNSTGTAVRSWSLDRPPSIVRIPASRNDAGRYEVRWVTSEHRGQSLFWFGTPDDYVLGYLEDENGVSQFKALKSISSNLRLPSGNYGANLSR
ncbi:WD40 domain protein [Aspergillus steynii IBT 23096]|uniref:WD40 domain protein n=1 Tax=Aspergillus steynii IBT 23096 TaxID=1392250 RepID=A0A2I2FVE8_9EURO|nr:WD40 domain protein [Aspergillus steynii IBT 23096]PLB44619.1 WD40 domain protein [Aspergillus steynii IBT 23096]